MPNNSFSSNQDKFINMKNDEKSCTTVHTFWEFSAYNFKNNVQLTVIPEENQKQ